MDCDILTREDIASPWRLRDDRYAVMVVKHDRVPKETVKFPGGPYFPEYADCEWSAEWRAERDAMLSASTRDKKPSQAGSCWGRGSAQAAPGDPGFR